MPKETSICDLFIKRQMGNFTKRDFDDLKKKASFLADSQIVKNQYVDHVRNITVNERSSYVIDSSDNGLAITSHTNRCVSVIDTANMKKVIEIKRTKRTIWTVAIHPYDSRLIATGSLDGNVSIYKNFKLFRSHNNNTFLPMATITSISFHPTYNIVCYAFHHKIFLWSWDIDTKATLNAHRDLKIKYAKFNPVNEMLITGILHENRDRHEYKLDHLINDNTQLSATYFLIKLFETINDILDTIEFTDYVDATPRWTEMLTKIVSFAGLLEVRRVVSLKQKGDSFLNYVNLEPTSYFKERYGALSSRYLFNGFLRSFLEAKRAFGCLLEMQDFEPTFQIFKRKILGIEKSIENYDELIRSFDATGIDVELAALRSIIARHYQETELLKNRNIIEPESLEDIFRRMNNIVVVHQCNPQHFNNKRIFAQYPRYQCKLQVWDFDLTNYPDLKQGWRNAITYCSLHNDSTVDISRNGKIIVSFRELATGCYMIAAYSLEKENLGEIIYTHQMDKLDAIMSVSLSPSLQYILVGVRSDRVYGYFLQISQQQKEMTKFELCDNDCSDSISYLKWMSRPGDGIIIGYNSFYLRFIRHF
ncbi:Activating molecule in BECN1-regulated autophagy protein 1B [Pseudolycoriella hygida]|uniref:Activating molecule in BECN1-regulated autophagy protein 1B n=1 Tax=Pseudolycoriella hygida TaxID=35572 RepID=A0A9Q0RY21_9DIPT|nr:Activating molecule in BECN1-regulated autophagy protein 1B [Pseudolycoriella hygida]